MDRNNSTSDPDNIGLLNGDITAYRSTLLPYASSPKAHSPINIATISSGFEKGDFLVREEKGQRVYFDFFEEAFNYVS